MKRLLFWGFVLLNAGPLTAQHGNSDSVGTGPLTQSAFFETTEPLLLTIRSDFSHLKRKKEKAVFLPATATLLLPNGETVSEPVQLAARGKFRRENCTMPSLMVNFRVPGAARLSGLKKLKMVCGCRESSLNEELVLKEYLTYRIFNLLTHLSFRVRLARVTYQDAGNNDKPFTQYGFFVEDVDAMAKRNGAREYAPLGRPSALTNRNQLTLVSVFQYMIGNLDWSVPNKHNIKLVRDRTDSLSLPFVVPYDFDFCGLVNAPYAFPQEQFPVERVTDRMYRGFPSAPAEIESILRLFFEKKPAIVALVDGFELLARRQRDGMLRFLEEFYRIAKNERDVKAIFVDAVRRH